MMAVFRRLSSASPTPGILVGLFLIAFSIPFFGTLLARSVYTYIQADSTASQAVQYGPLGDPGDFIASKALRVASVTGLDPVAGSDFLVYGWFSLKDLPAVDHNLILLEKRDGRDRRQPGYSVGIRHDKDAFRPIVYWRDRAGRGRWFSFSDMEILPRTWMMLALSFRDGRYIGLHGSLRISESDVRSKLLGGYDLQQTILPHTDSPLVAGSINDRRLKVKLGPVGVVSGPGLSGDFKAVLKDVIKRPLQPPATVRNSNVVLWTVSGQDQSGKPGNKIELVGTKEIAHD